jgi:hypothetical protein
VKQEANPRINGVPIEPGDWIGTFFLDNGVMKCAGADVWKSGGVIFNSYDDDLRTPDIKEGFSYGERVNVKIYSQKAKRDYDVTSMSFDLTDEAYVENRWYPLSLCVVIDMRADTGT